MLQPISTETYDFIAILTNLSGYSIFVSYGTSGNNVEFAYVVNRVHWDSGKYNMKVFTGFNYLGEVFEYYYTTGEIGWHEPADRANVVADFEVIKTYMKNYEILSNGWFFHDLRVL